MRIVDGQTLTLNEQTEWANWLNSRPKQIKEAAQKYPPGIYQIKRPEDVEGSPREYLLVGYDEYEDVDKVTAILRYNSGMLDEIDVFNVELHWLVPVHTLDDVTNGQNRKVLFQA